MTLATSPRPCLYPCSLRGQLYAPMSSLGPVLGGAPAGLGDALQGRQLTGA